MDDLYLIRAGQAAPFVNTAIRLRAPVTSLARQANLPLSSIRKGEGVIGERSLWDFIELLTELPGFGLMGYQTAMDHPISTSSQLGGMNIHVEANLGDLLDSFNSGARTESSGSDYSIAMHDGSPWFIRVPIYRNSGASWQTEMYVIAFIIQIIRLCAPGDWLPAEIHLSATKFRDSTPPEWQGINFLAAKETRIKLSQELLELPPRLSRKPSSNEPFGRWESNAPMHIRDLIDRQIWNDRVSLDLAAAELGMSSATFKRRLRAMGTSYAKSLQERRAFLASRLLAQTNMHISEIAKAMGYTAVSNFSRAFSKAKGLSPSKYRSGRGKGLGGAL